MIVWPKELIEAVARRRCVLILGAGASASAKNTAGSSPKTWRAFLKSAADQLSPRPRFITAAIAENRLLEACQYLKEKHGNNWLNILRAEFVDPHYKGSELHAALYELDVRTSISLNFDNIYESYVNKVTEGTFVVKDYYDTDIRQTVAGTDRYLLKMHGSVHTPAKMIFTGKDYARSRTENRSFYDLINSLLHTHVCLLIGCGLNDPDVQMLFEDYRHVLDTTPHYQTVPGPIPDEVSTVVRDNRGINLLPYSKKDNHRELIDSIVKLKEDAGLVRDDLAGSREW